VQLYQGRYSPNQFRYRRRVLWKLLKTARLLTRPTLARQDAPYPKQGRSERKAEAYSEYVEALREARTTLAVVFNSFLLVILVFRV
jgi:hypothetical protein